MVKMKKTPRKSDAKGRLPPLAPHHLRTEWGTASETFHKRLVLPLDPRRGDVSYKGKYCRYIQMLNLSNIYKVACIILYCYFIIIIIRVVCQETSMAKGKVLYPPKGKRWRLGMQALREIRQLMRTTMLCIPKTPFLWYVEHVKHRTLI